VRLRYTERARADVELAFEWYEKQRRGLGFELLDCIEIATKQILVFPEAYQLSYKNFRRCVTRRFPFSLFYTIEEDVIVIHSVFDNRMDPGKRP
jgi:toxin ParE1/3/4